VVLKASGRDTRGQGNAAALVTAVMTEQGEGMTLVSITTDLTVSGRVAQFGRGVMADVSAKLLQQFVDNLEADVLGRPAGDGTPADAPAVAGAAPAGGQAGGSGAGSGAARENEPVRVVGIVVKSMLSQLRQAIAKLFRRSGGQR
jgi:hypothetical protein